MKSNRKNIHNKTCWSSAFKWCYWFVQLLQVEHLGTIWGLSFKIQDTSKNQLTHDIVLLP